MSLPMPHAQSAEFQGLSKTESYKLVVWALKGLLVTNWVSNLANAAALLWAHFHGQPNQSSVNWAGFYTLEGQQLELGPFQGKIACQTIAKGRGVCGTAFQKETTVVVPDVGSFEGHIACDGDTKSEIVVPITRNGRVLGVIDIDSTQTNTFDNEDAAWLQRVADLLAESLEAKLN